MANDSPKSAASSANDPPTAKKVKYMEWYVNYCKMLSMWPREEINFLRYWIIFFLMFFCSLWILMAMYAKILLHYRDIDGIAEVIDFATVYTSGFFRLIYVHVNGKNYSDLVAFIDVNFVHVSFGRGDRATMDPAVRHIRKVINIYLVITFIWFLQMVFGPIVMYEIKKMDRYDNGTYVDPELELKMTIDVPMPFDLHDRMYLAITYVLHFFSYTAMTNIYICTDTFWFATLMLTIAQFDMIIHSLRNLSSTDLGHDSQEKNESEDETDLRELEMELKSCIRQHKLLRQCVRKIEVLMRPIVLVDFLHAVTSISFIMLDMIITLHEHTIHKFVNLAEYLIVSVFHMFMLDYLGNELLLKETEISLAVHEIPWYNHRKKLKYNILIMTILSRNPQRLTGGKMYTICLDFFVGTIRTIFSYFMVLLQLRRDK